MTICKNNGRKEWLYDDWTVDSNVSKAKRSF